MASTTIAAESSRSGAAPIGVGSLPGRLFEDGTVCVVSAQDPSRCKKTLFKLSDEIVKTNVSVAISGKPYRRENFFQVPVERAAHHASLAFYGIFDIDNDGVPEVFLDYSASEAPECPKKYLCGDACCAITLVVYKKVGATYQPYLKLYAESQGYSPGAWFLAESPVRKAIFMTRYQGSAGGALFSLDFQKRTLHRFTEEIYVWHEPVFGDVDGNGVAEILVRSRAYGNPIDIAALFRWANGSYQPWRDWILPSVYIVDAQLGAVDTSLRKAIIAVLAPRDDALKRELGIWKLGKGTWARIATAKLPDGQWGRWGPKASPEIVQVVRTHQGTTMNLAYEDSTLTCIYRKGKVTCSDPVKR